MDGTTPRRVGCYAYGSGCSSEFFSGCTAPGPAGPAASARLADQLKSRYQLSMAEYDGLLDEAAAQPFGVQDHRVDRSKFQKIYDDQFAGRGLLVLDGISNYHREYVWS